MNNYEIRTSHGNICKGSHTAYYPSKAKAMISAYGRCRGIRNDCNALSIKYLVWNIKTEKCVGGYEVAMEEYSLQTPDYQTAMRRTCKEINTEILKLL